MGDSSKQEKREPDIESLATPPIPGKNDSYQLNAAANAQLPGIPSYEPMNYQAPSGEQSDLPPNYFDVSIVPSGAILYPHQIPPITQPSTVKIERSKHTRINIPYCKDVLMKIKVYQRKTSFIDLNIGSHLTWNRKRWCIFQ
jgi:hypothetical protein